MSILGKGQAVRYHHPFLLGFSKAGKKGNCMDSKNSKWAVETG